MKVYEYEGKTEEELILKALNELDVKDDELVYSSREETSGLLKKKKIILRVMLKTDVLEFAKKYIKTLVEAMGLEVNLETKRKENYILIKMHSNNNALLIGKNGKTLDSIQLLVRQAIYSNSNIYANIILDVEDYKEKHQRSIEMLAKKLAKEVVNTQIEIKMDSMNSYERRLVHNILKDFKGVKTESEGEEPDRCVVIKPSK
jgi:spoIIIJ-associated protein